ncbi:MAG: hypothetical protein ACREMN_05270, partial [Gemmatimonadales bacterium]
MVDSHAFAAVFARALEHFRDPSAKEEQKREFRALVAMLKQHGATLAARDGRLVVNGTSLGGAPLDALAQRLEFHAIGEITIPSNPPLQETFELLRALAEPPETDDVAARLLASGARHISVAMQPTFRDIPAMPAEPPGSPPDLGAGGRRHDLADITSGPPGGVPAAPRQSPAPAPAMDVPPIAQQ